MANDNDPKTPWQIVEQEFQCLHPNKEVRYKLDRTGRKMYLGQCLQCGEATSSFLKYSDVPKDIAISPFDEELSRQYQAKKRAKLEEIYEEQRRLQASRASEWWIAYSEYLKSPKWQTKRKKVLDRDHYLCQACLERRANQAHHLSYDHVFNEPLFELIAVCEPCHKFLTELDAQRRENNERPSHAIFSLALPY